MTSDAIFTVSNLCRNFLAGWLAGGQRSSAHRLVTVAMVSRCGFTFGLQYPVLRGTPHDDVCLQRTIRDRRDQVRMWAGSPAVMP